MTSNAIDNLLFVQYSPGAGGRMFLVCCTTSNKLANWLPDELPDPIEYTRKMFCNPVKQDHMKTETQPPYKLSWFTRQPPFTRGDNLTRDQAETLFLEDPIIQNEIVNKRLIPIYYVKKYYPTWFQGKVITLVNDEYTTEWLMQRRKDVFYKVENSKVYKLRYMSEHINNSQNIKKFSDQPQTEFAQEEFNNILKQDFDVECLDPGPGININLNDYFTWDTNKLWDTVCPIVGEVDRYWSNKAIKEWRKYWL